MIPAAPFLVHVVCLHPLFFESKVLRKGQTPDPLAYKPLKPGPLLLPAAKPLEGAGLVLLCTDGQHIHAASAVSWHQGHVSGVVRAELELLQTDLPAVALGALTPRPPLTLSDDACDASSTDVSSTSWPALKPLLLHHEAWREALHRFEPALMIAMVAAGHISRLAAMIEQGADPNAYVPLPERQPMLAEDREAPIDRAALHGQIEVATWLLEHGARPTKEALRHAIIRGDRAMVALLLNHGISAHTYVPAIGHRYMSGPTFDSVPYRSSTPALQLAEEHGHDDLILDLQARLRAHVPLEGGSYRKPPRPAS